MIFYNTYDYEVLKGPNDSNFFVKDIWLDPILRSLFWYPRGDCNFTVTEGIGTTVLWVGLFKNKTKQNPLL